MRHPHKKLWTTLCVEMTPNIQNRPEQAEHIPSAVLQSLREAFYLYEYGDGIQIVDTDAHSQDLLNLCF